MKKNKTTVEAKTVLKTMFLFVGVVAVIYAGILLRQVEIPVVLPVQNIQVNGDLQFLDKDMLTALLKERIEGGYFTVDLPMLRETLMQHPWIRDASLRREWPASIKVSIEEKVPVAYWNDDAYISAAGDVFKPETRLNSLALPLLNGPQGRHGEVWKFMNTLYSEMALLEYQVVRLDLDDRRAWQMVITGDVAARTVTSSDKAASAYSGRVDGFVVKLGRFETYKRLQRFVRILPALIEENQAAADMVSDSVKNKNIEVIDMRYPNGFAVQLSSQHMSEA